MTDPAKIASRIVDPVCPKCGMSWAYVVSFPANLSIIARGWQPTCGCGECQDEDLSGNGVTNFPPTPIPKEEFEKKFYNLKIEKRNGNEK